MSPRQTALLSHIKRVQEVYPDAVYALHQGLWYIKGGGDLVSFGQHSPYEAWYNAARIIDERRAKGTLPKVTNV